MKTWSLLALSPTFHPHFVAQILASVFDTQSALHYLTDQGCLEAMLYVNLDLLYLFLSPYKVQPGRIPHQYCVFVIVSWYTDS